ncbi:MAG: hypothetical protein ABII88_00100 [Candidatus Omnitrophota bacterium]
MKYRKFFAVALILTGICIVPSAAYAGRGTKFKKVDKNKDGVIDRKEVKIEKKQQEKRAAWRYTDSKVNTVLEKKYDTDGNGFLQPAEAQELLKAKYALIKTHGKAKVDTELEKQYDTDNDGILSLQESKELYEDIQ